MRGGKGGVMKYYTARFIPDRDIVPHEATGESVEQLLSEIAVDNPFFKDGKVEYYTAYFKFMALSLIHAQKFLLSKVPYFTKYVEYRRDEQENFLIRRAGRIMMITETLPRAMGKEDQLKYFEIVCDTLENVCRGWTPPENTSDSIILFEDDVQNREEVFQEMYESLLHSHPDTAPPGQGKTDPNAVQFMRESNEHLRKYRYKWQPYNV